MSLLSYISIPIVDWSGKIEYVRVDLVGSDSSFLQFCEKTLREKRYRPLKV